MDKNAQFDIRYSIYWVIIIVVITLTIFAIALLLSGYIGQLTKQPAGVQSSLLALRFGMIPECFAYQFPDGTAKEQSIDLSHFTSEQMARCYTTPQERGYKTFNFRLKLLRQNKEVISNNYYFEYTDTLTLFREVNVWDGRAFVPDTLMIYVQERIGT